MEEERCMGSLHPRTYAKKMTSSAYETNPRKRNKTKCTFYLLRSGGQPRPPNGISVITSSFDV
jgi:hypothetical protein